MKAPALILVVLFSATAVIAQIDKEKFEEIFEEEFSDPKYSLRENHSGAYQYVKPQQLPQWFLNLPVASRNEVYAIGISDPEPDTALAFETAVYRAQVMANVLRKSTVQLLCDFYINEADQSVNVAFEHFSRINAFLPQNAEFTVVETFRNSFDETLVLIKYKSPKRPKPAELFSVKMELYKNEIESTAYGNFESVFELQVLSGNIAIPDPMLYQLTELGTRADVISSISMSQKQIPIYSLKYITAVENDSLTYSYFSHGLWKEYLKSVMVYIIGEVREKPENITQMTDAYNKNSVDKLTRGISVNKIGFSLNRIEAAENTLKVFMQQQPVK